MTKYVTIYEEADATVMIKHRYKDVETCSVVNSGCTSPANQEFPKVPARGVCFSCGLPVCAKCSKRRKYMGYGLRRICDNCIEEMEK